MVSDDQLFCAAPFRQISVNARRVHKLNAGKGPSLLRPAGDVYLCCPDWLKTPPAGNLLFHSMDHIWNGELARKIRESILDGSFRYCDRDVCPHLQSFSFDVCPAGAVTDPCLKDIIQHNRRIPAHGPREIICGYDLSCPSCRKKPFVENRNAAEIHRVQKTLERSFMADVEKLVVAGTGDPFGSPFYRHWLQTIHVDRLPRLEQIMPHTNGLLWIPTIWKTIPLGTRERITSTIISIDAGCEATYNVNRRGGNFKRLLKNLEFISELRRDGPLRHLKFTMTVQENNFREMKAFVELGKRSSADSVSFTCLCNWGTYSSEDYQRRAVHLPGHESHGELMLILSDSLFKDPIVNLGNLYKIVPDR